MHSSLDLHWSFISTMAVLINCVSLIASPRWNSFSSYEDYWNPSLSYWLIKMQTHNAFASFSFFLLACSRQIGGHNSLQIKVIMVEAFWFHVYQCMYRHFNQPLRNQIWHIQKLLSKRKKKKNSKWIILKNIGK